MQLKVIMTRVGTKSELSFEFPSNRPSNHSLNIRSVLRRQSRQRYKSKHEKVGVLQILIVKSNVSSVGPSSERNSCHDHVFSDEGPTLETLRLYYSYRQYTNLFIFQFVSHLNIQQRWIKITANVIINMKFWEALIILRKGTERNWHFLRWREYNCW